MSKPFTTEYIRKFPEMTLVNQQLSQSLNAKDNILADCQIIPITQPFLRRFASGGRLNMRNIASTLMGTKRGLNRLGALS